MPRVRFAPCSVPGCDRCRSAQGLCSMHYHRALNAGIITRKPKRTEMERFLAFTAPDPKTGCLIWTGARNETNYGVFTRANGKYVGAHRFALEASLGRRLRHAEFACHGCDNPPCVRVGPGHIFLGSPTANVHDMMAKGRQRVVLPDVRGERHPHAKLTDAAVREVRARLARGEHGADVARALGISHSRVSAIKHGRAWTHVSEVR